MRSQSAGSDSMNGTALSQPALLTRTSMRPCCSWTARTMAATPARSVTSVCSPTASPPMAAAVAAAVDAVEVGDGDHRPLGGELLGDRPTDALPGAGDDRDLPLELSHGRVPDDQRTYMRRPPMTTWSPSPAITPRSAATART